MGLQLYPHNQTAYLAALKMMEAHGKAAVIHPTGTGKSFLAFQLALEHPKDLILWLAPSEYIYRTQLRGLASAMPRLAPGGPSNILFLTYAKLMRAEGGMDALCPDWIVLDEFHRAGSPQWGSGVRKLIGAYKEARLLGLSATKIRYLDDCRDMAEELFEGRVASEMSLGEAVARGILPAPTYILSVYSYQKEMERLKARIRATQNPALCRNAERLFAQLKRALEHADGLDKVFEKRPHGKYLVFCSGKEHMQAMMGQCLEWLKQIDSKPHLYGITYEDPDAKRKYLAFQEDESDHIKLLFSIDMLNEGVHVDGVDGVILLRPTVSPILYLQQIGRALSAGRDQKPVIFDIVNNFESLSSIDGIRLEAEAYFGNRTDLEWERRRFEEQFRIIDETRDCRRIFERLAAGLSVTWDGYYLEAKAYFEENGHLRVPNSYVTPSGLALGAWLATQRRVFCKKAAGSLSEGQAARLEAIGMDWREGPAKRFERGLCALQDYVSQYGNADVAVGYVSEDGYPLGKWVSNIRSKQKKAAGRPLTEEQLERLNAAGMIWDRAAYQWEQHYALAEAYYKSHGNLKAPRSYVAEDGTALGIWIENQRGAYAGKKKDAAPLTVGQIQKLEKIGMEWGLRQERQWEEKYLQAKRYYNEHGNLRVPAAYVAENGALLGRWVSRQREREKKQALSPRQKELLQGIGF